jgi:tetratricopeptide (TPR) repeat protein
VTDQLMRTDGGNIDVQNERALDLEIDADVQDATGNRLGAIESFRRVFELRQAIGEKNPDYPGNRRALALSTAHYAMQVGRFGVKADARPVIDSAVRQFEALQASAKDDVDLVHEVTSAINQRGEIRLMMGDVAGAQADYRLAHERIARAARLDPQNTVSQSDLRISDFLNARAVAVQGEYARALPMLVESLAGYEALHLEADVGPGPAAMRAWVGEAQVGLRRFADALVNYRKAAASLEEDAGNYDDARCDLAVVETKIGSVLMRMGRQDDAAAEFAKALTVADLATSLEHMDIPAIYAGVDAHAGLADVALARAGATADDDARAPLLRSARDHYQAALDAIVEIPNWRGLSGNGYLAAVSQAELRRRLASVQPRSDH